MGVPAGYHQTNERWLQFFILDIICADMSFNMMYSDKRYSGCKADCLGSRYAYQQCANQARSIGYCDGIHIGKLALCLL